MINSRVQLAVFIVIFQVGKLRISEGFGGVVDVAEYVRKLLLQLHLQIDVERHVNGLKRAVRLDADTTGST